jgi:hypothetical protein
MDDATRRQLLRREGAAIAEWQVARPRIEAVFGKPLAESDWRKLLDIADTLTWRLWEIAAEAFPPPPR